MHEVFKREIVYRDDLVNAEGLTEREVRLRDELLVLMQSHGTDIAVPELRIRGYVREGLEEDVEMNARPIYPTLYGYIKWDELVEQRIKDSWFCEELSDGSEWWFND